MALAARLRGLLPGAAGALLALLLGAAAAPAEVCGQRPVLTALATDTAAQQTLLALSGSAPDGPRHWLVVLDTASRTARLHPAPLAALRTAASHGPGPFLAAERCGDDCFQPLRWQGSGWQELGYPLEFDPSSTLHFTYDHSGVPWLVFHQLTDRKGILTATAYRWSGERWSRAGNLLVQGVGSPGAVPDPEDPGAILTGTGRFKDGEEPGYWLPALPALSAAAPAGPEGGQVVALPGGGALFLTFDGRIATSDDGRSWQLERWTPWPNPLRRADLWQPGVDYSIDRPAGGSADQLYLLWYDERRSDVQELHLTRWGPALGWRRDATLDLGDPAAGGAEHILYSQNGWLLVGACVETGAGSALEALLVTAGGDSRRLEIPLSRAAD